MPARARADLARRGVAELVGTAFLVAVVVGSGIAAERLSADAGLRLFENAVATALGLAALVLAFGPVSGAHLNPVVSLVDRLLGGLSNRELAVYAAAQLAGGAAGSVVANLMYSLPAAEWASTGRSGAGLWLAELVATGGLVLVVFGVTRSDQRGAAAFAVGGYIGAACFFTASTSFANPAVTVARSLTDTFTGIAPGSVPAFVAAQVAGAGAAVALVRFLYPDAHPLEDLGTPGG